ncbi:hypothetical protein [Ramlibacter rhizophilus]|uniref:VanZ family protein n=1 Tax=Ramlibacter rhizophilus TaxID=1781167 RepID=A0A4Z0BP10_9BURK|nr:hypothetical protein [Ramlibacter rhizophilus]TFZ00008.1 hypothetical protein EZ242_12835 [Ramlibacter rhizophilus]
MQPLSRTGVPLLLVLLFVGTLMPGAWKIGALDRIGGPLDLAALAHVLLFAGLAFLWPYTRWLAPQGRWQLPVFGLALALLTEGLQFFADGRHPNLAGVLQDLLGVLLGSLLGRLSAPARLGG